MIGLIAYEIRLRRRTIVGFFVILALYIGLIMWAWSQGMEDLGELYEQIMQKYPKEFIKLFGKGVPLALTPEVFYTVEYFVFMYVMIMGAYVAYLGAGITVDDVLERSGGLALSLPVTRRTLLISRFIAITLLALIINLISLTLTFILSHVFGVGDDLKHWNIVLLHLHGFFYMTACISMGVLLGSLLPFHLAKPIAAGLAIIAYIVDSMTLDTSLEGIGYITLSRYLPVLEIATEGSIYVRDICVLLLVSLVFITVASILYQRRDLPM